MPKNIVVCLDGTWNNAVGSTTEPTNIHWLYQSLSPDGQYKSYQVGVGEHAGRLGKVVFGATGKGVFQTARLAWQQVSGNYEPGDKIYIFGFSRGAFAARALAGMIVRKGLVAFEGMIEESFREWFASANQPCTQIAAEVEMLGLFDCVPGNQFFVIRDRSHHLNTPDLEPGIRHFRHAVSRDERRWGFKPLLFRHNVHHQSFVQAWFPGYHSDVGGGNKPSSGLAAFSLWWMIREAYGLGLNFRNIQCPHPPASHTLSMIRSVDPDARPVPSDYWTTRIGLRWNRTQKETVIVPSETPLFQDLDTCPRCGCDMFDYFLTDHGQKKLKRMGIRPR